MKTSVPIFFAVIPLLLAVAPRKSEAQPGMTPPGRTPPNVPPWSPGGPAEPAPNFYPPAPYASPIPQDAQPQNTGRSGFHFGFSASTGIMESDQREFSCGGCATTAGVFEIHVGAMLTPRLALQAEMRMQARSLDSRSGVTLTQSMLLIAVQYWITPKLWIKAGTGESVLALNYNQSVGQQSENFGRGVALHAGAGYEIVEFSSFSIDAQLATEVGNYADRNENVSVTSIGLGINWY